MNDTISRQMAIDALGYCQTYLFDSFDKDKKISLEDAEYAIEQLPTADQTLYGYNIEHLAFIAALLQKENIQPEELKYMLTDIRIMMQFVVDDITDTMQREICNG